MLSRAGEPPAGKAGTGVLGAGAPGTGVPGVGVLGGGELGVCARSVPGLRTTTSSSPKRLLKRRRVRTMPMEWGSTGVEHNCTTAGPHLLCGPVLPVQSDYGGRLRRRKAVRSATPSGGGGREPIRPPKRSQEVTETSCDELEAGCQRAVRSLGIRKFGEEAAYHADFTFLPSIHQNALLRPAATHHIRF
jgi:hypothetical protein